MLKLEHIFKVKNLLAALVFLFVLQVQAKAQTSDFVESSFDKDLAGLRPTVATVFVKEGKVTVLDKDIDKFNRAGVFRHVALDKMSLSLKVNRIVMRVDKSGIDGSLKKIFEMFESVSRARALLAFVDNEKTYLLMRSPDKSVRMVSVFDVSFDTSAAEMQRTFGKAFGYNGVVVSRSGEDLVVAGEKKLVEKRLQVLARDESVGTVVPEIRLVQPRAILTCEPFGTGILARCRKIVGEDSNPGTALWFPGGSSDNYN